MVDIDKQLQELKKEVVEARNLVIRNDNILKNLHADLKVVLDKQKGFERRSLWTSASAYLIFAALAGVGAFKYAASEIREKTAAAVQEKSARDKADASLKEKDALLAETHTESVRALELFDALAGPDDAKRSKALSEIATMTPKNLTELEKRALKDKSLSLRIAAAQAALENGRSAMNRRDYRSAKEELTQYLKLAAKPDESAHFMLGEAMHGLREYKDAVEPLRAYLKSAPSSKSAEYATLLLGESLAESGEAKSAIEVYRAGGNRYGSSQLAVAMRARARHLDQAQREAANKPH
jgi:TolA-binding protein